MLTAIIALPLVGVALLLGFGATAARARAIALGAVVAELALTAALFAAYEGADGYSFIERADWIPALGVQYLLGVDGLSVPMVLLNGILGVAALRAVTAGGMNRLGLEPDMAHHRNAAFDDEAHGLGHR